MFTGHVGVNGKQIVYCANGCLATENTTEMIKSQTTDLFVWTDNKVKLLLKVTQERKEAKAVENILRVAAMQTWRYIRLVSGALSINRGSHNNWKGIPKQKG